MKSLLNQFVLKVSTYIICLIFILLIFNIILLKKKKSIKNNQTLNIVSLFTPEL